MTTSTARKMTWKEKAWRSLTSSLLQAPSSPLSADDGRDRLSRRAFSLLVASSRRPGGGLGARTGCVFGASASDAATTGVGRGLCPCGGFGARCDHGGDGRCPPSPVRLNAEHLRALASENIETVWHFAASLRFEKAHSSELMADNVGGTRNAMATARAIGARRFVYISTAYSCGAAEGSVGEELHSLAGPFNNAYEESKCQAEHVVMAESSSLGLQSIIVRPSIVVGPSTTWRTGGSEFRLLWSAGTIAAPQQLAARNDPPTDQGRRPTDRANERGAGRRRDPRLPQPRNSGFSCQSDHSLDQRRRTDDM